MSDDEKWEEIKEVAKRYNWPDELLERLKQHEKNGECRIELDEEGKLERHVDRVSIEICVRRGELTWTLYEVEEMDGEGNLTRIRFNHPQGRVNRSVDGEGEERWRKAARRELSEEINFELEFRDGGGNDSLPKPNPDFIADCDPSTSRSDPEISNPGGSFPGIPRVTETHYFQAEVRESISEQIDLQQEITERKKNGRVSHFRWFPKNREPGEYGEGSIGILPTHANDLLDALKQITEPDPDNKSGAIDLGSDGPWAALLGKMKEEENPDTGKPWIDEDDMGAIDLVKLCEILDNEHKNKRDKRGKRDIKYGMHHANMQKDLHHGDRQSAMVRFDKTLREWIGAKRSGRFLLLAPIKPYGMLTRVFGSSVLSKAEDVATRLDEREILQEKIWGDEVEGLTIPDPFPAPPEKMKKEPWAGWVKKRKEMNSNQNESDANVERYAKGQQIDWKKWNKYIIRALGIDCPKGTHGKEGQPCPRGDGWATSLHGKSRNKKSGNLGETCRIAPPDAANYITKIQDEFKNSDGLKDVETDYWDGWGNVETDHWEKDWEEGFPFVCRQRLHAVSQNLKLDDVFYKKSESKTRTNLSSLYISKESPSAISLRNRVIHSLQRYLLKKRVEKPTRYRIQPRDVNHALKHPVAEILSNDWKKWNGIDLDGEHFSPSSGSKKKHRSVPIEILEYSEGELTPSSTGKWDWKLFNEAGEMENPIPGESEKKTGFIPSVQIDSPMTEIYAAFSQGHNAVVIRRDYYVDEKGEPWEKPDNIPTNDEEFEVNENHCITLGQLIQSAAENGRMLKMGTAANVFQIRSAIGVLEASTFLHESLPALLNRLAEPEQR